MASDVPAPAALGTTLPSSEDGATAVELVRGATIGRYTILEKVGAGGMGVVYAAYDPQLDRRIALKALHAASDPERDTAGRSRLIREAKAMARLSHPNVVAVYDVLVEGEQVLVAMELVEGQSLHSWLESRKREWREVLGVFLQAGRGLAAAHDAGMVHRDFKLDNVFVGNDGRVRVGDFGLARSASKERASRKAKRDDLGPLVSREGMLAGTPAYMAPDQLRGDPADARSDQFSFCAALHEGLYGTAPFPAATLESLVESMEEERVLPPPANTQVPGWLRAIVARGLRSRPKDRFHDMHALLRALENDPRRARMWRGTAAALGLAAIGVGALVLHNRRAEELECRALERRLDGVWDDGKRHAVRDAFVATGRPYAEDTFARTSRVLDDYGAAWAKQAVGTCRDHLGPPALRTLAAQRATCLDDRLSELHALASVFVRAEGETVDRAVQGARALPALDVCAGKDPLRGRPMPADPASRHEAEGLEEQMNVATALDTAGRYPEGVALATVNLATAERIEFRPMIASALLSLAKLQNDAGDLPDAERTYRRASVAAETAGAGRSAALAWIGAAYRAAERGDFARADECFEHAAAWVERVGDDDALRAELFLKQGERLNDEGKHDEARVLSGKALPLFERLGNDEAAAEALTDLGISSDLQGHYDAARSFYEAAMARYAQLLGPEHPKVARVLGDLGMMAGDEGKLEDAAKALEGSLRIRQRALGPNHPDVARGMYNLAFTYIALDRFVDANTLAQSAIPVIEKAFGAESAEMAYALMALVGSLNGLHRPLEAIAPAEKDLAIRIKTGPPAGLADAQADLGRALVQSRQDVSRGRMLLRQAKDGYQALGRTNRLVEVDEVMKASYEGH